MAAVDLRAAKADHPSAEDYICASWLLMCEVAALRAVGEVEAGREGAFLETGEPVILFERHLFNRLTADRFRGAKVPDAPAGVTWAVISWPEAGGYGPVSVQHRRLQAAAALDRDAALSAASWGLFQILGSNHRAAGYSTLLRYISAMYRSATDHLRALAMFIRADDRLVDAIRERRWADFARFYNGPAYRRNLYDEKLAAAYARLSRAA